MPYKCPPFIVAAAASALALAVTVSAPVRAAQPAAPPQICVNNVCKATPTTATATAAVASGSMKWNPGHYAECISRPSTPASTGASQATMNDMSAAKSSSGRFMGYQGEYTWYYLENATGGSYRTDIIDNDLAYLAQKSAADGVDYKLIIFMEDEGFQPVASTPQAVAYSAGNGQSSLSVAPDYIINGVTPGAGPGVINNGYGVAQVALWRQNEMTAYINLINYLGNKYDSNPHVEAIVPIVQTGYNLGNLSDPTYSAAAMATQLGRLAAAMKTSWPTTNKILFNNWALYNSGNNISQLTSLTQTVVAAGFGMGGPDILYVAGGAPTSGSQVELGAGGAFGNINYIGKVPLIYEDQANWANWTNQTQAGTESYAYNTLQATHTVWEDAPSGVTGGKYPQTEWPATISALDAVNFRIHSGYPSSYP